MIKNGILSIVFATLVLCGAIPHVNAATFTLNNVVITDFDEVLNVDEALDIHTDSSTYLPHTTPNLLVGSAPYDFAVFDLWTGESNITADDLNPKPISVDFSFSVDSGDAITGGPITGTTVGSGDPYTIPIPPYVSYINDQGNVNWGPSVTFSFGNGGEFTITLSDAIFNRGNGIDLIGGQANGATIRATLDYVQAPTVVPVPPAIILLGTGILGIAGIRRKFKK